MADIFVSYTSSDREWAFWIGQELEKLGHTAHVHDWEISGGSNIMAWMEERHDKADSVLCVVSRRYLDQPYSALERHGAQWAAASKRPNFLLPVFVELCEAPTLLAPFKHCDLHGLNEDDARERLAFFMKPAAKPTGPVSFPGATKPSVAVPATPVAFPGGPRALSNIPVAVPRFFLGRDEVLTEIKAALAKEEGRVAITALHGLRGVGKTTLAAAYADRHRVDYRATWWIRAETESTMRADLVGLGVRLGWVDSDAPEEQAVAAVLERLRGEGDGILLVYDNANNPGEIRNYRPLSGIAQIIITSNAPNWGNVAAPVKIRVWPKEVGAEYLTVRTGRNGEQNAALTLSESLGGLPLAHEQAAAYCERLGITIVEYGERFETTPSQLLDAERDAPAEYHDRLTVAKTFALAIEEAAKLHPAAKQLISYAALLAPEPIPLFLFSEAREEFDEPLASSVEGGGLDEAVAALRAFALVDRETIPDEREPEIMTDCIRLHRLVRQVASVGLEGESGMDARRALIAALAKVHPDRDDFRSKNNWVRARRLQAFPQALLPDRVPPDETEGFYRNAIKLMDKQNEYLRGHARELEAETQDLQHTIKKVLAEGVLDIYKRSLESGHPDSAARLKDLGNVLENGDISNARPYLEQALAGSEVKFGPDNTYTGAILAIFGMFLRVHNDPAGARLYYERALAIREKVLGLADPATLKTAKETALLLDELGHQNDASALRQKFGVEG